MLKNFFAFDKDAIENLSSVDWLIVVCLIVLVTIAGYQYYESYNAEIVVKTAASNFAAGFDQLKELAVRRNSPLNISIHPSTMTRSASYVVQDSNTKIIEYRLPHGVEASGMVTLDSRGHPIRAARFNFRKGRYRSTVWIHKSGAVEIPGSRSKTES